MSELSDLQEQASEAITELLKKHNLAVDGLTQEQFAECIRQAIACGDFVKYVAHRYDPKKMAEDALHFNPAADPSKMLTEVTRQSVVYIPFREVEQLKAKIKELEQRLSWHAQGTDEIGLHVEF